MASTITDPSTASDPTTLEVRSIYDKVYAKVKELAEMVYIGGSTSLPGLDESLSQGFTESVITPFKAGTVVGGGVGDPTTILARGCALQAHLLVSVARESLDELLGRFNKVNKVTSVAATSRTIGLLVPHEDAAGSLGGIWIPLVLKETPLPCRRTLTFEVDASGAGAKVGFELWEVKEGVKIDHVKPPKFEEEEEEEELEQAKEKPLAEEAYLASLSLSPNKGKTTVLGAGNRVRYQRAASQFQRGHKRRVRGGSHRDDRSAMMARLPLLGRAQ